MIVYRHIRLDKNEVFYVGIAKVESRPYDKRSRNKHWKNITNLSDYRVDILFDDLTWEEACEKEIELIKLYGRKDLGLGTLINMTDGGEGKLGCSTWKGKKHSQESIEKMKQSRKNQVFSLESREKMSISRRKRITTDESREKMRISQTGRKHTEETKKKMSDSHKRVKK